VIAAIQTIGFGTQAVEARERQVNQVAASADVASLNWRTDGSVSAMALSDHGTIYIGGTFTNIGRPVGPGVLVDPSSSVVDTTPSIRGTTVNAAVGDGNGGWYVGGSFFEVGRSPRQNLAHVLSNGTVDPAWNPGANGVVYDLELVGSTLYVAGNFTTLGGQPRSRLGAVGSLGVVTPFSPAINGLVQDVGWRNATLYAAGNFGTANGATRNRLAAFAADGTLTGWNPSADGTATDLVASDDAVYVAGMFNTIGGAARYRLAAVDPTTGVATSWNSGLTSGNITALLISGPSLYVAGNFSSISGRTQSHLAAFSRSTGAIIDWVPSPNAIVAALNNVGDTVVASGAFSSIAGSARSGVAAFDATTRQLTSWQIPALDAAPAVIARSGSSTFVGGAFRRAQVVARQNLAELSLTNGEATAWQLAANGPVGALQRSGPSMFVGGDFTTLGGASRSRLGAFSMQSGGLTNWVAPALNGRVTALTNQGSSVYAGGYFTLAGTTTRKYAAAFNTDTGTLTAWNPNLYAPWGTYYDPVSALEATATSIYLGGSFSTVGGVSRPDLAAVDLVSGALTSWVPAGSKGIVGTLALLDGTLVVGGASPGPLVSQYNLTTGARTSLTPNVVAPSGEINGVVITDDVVYVAGTFISLCVDGTTTSVRYLAEVDRTTGALRPWLGDGRTLSVPESMIATDGALLIGGQVGDNPAAGATALQGSPTWFVPAPENSTLPSLPSSATVDQAVTADVGSWSGQPSLKTQWLRDGTAIPGATAVTYSPTHDDTGRELTARVTATNLGGSTNATTPGVRVQGPPINDGAPSATGTPANGQTLTASTGEWRAQPSATYTYQWRMCDNAGESCNNITGSANQTRTLTVADVDSTLRVVVTACNAAGCASSTSAATPVVIAAACQPDNSCVNASAVCDQSGGSETAGGGSASPILTHEGDTLVAEGTSVDTTISANPDNGILIQSDDASVCLTPVETAPEAHAAQLQDQATGAHFADTTAATDTEVIPKADGVETFETIHDDNASEDFSWKAHLDSGQSVVPSADGEVAILDASTPDDAPDPAPVTPADAAEIPGLIDAGTIDPDTEAPNPTAVAAAEGAVANSNVLSFSAPASSGDTTAAEQQSAPPSGTDVALPTQVVDGLTSALPAEGPPAGLDPPADPTVLPAEVVNELTDGAVATQNEARTVAQQQLDQAQADLSIQNTALADEQDANSVQAPAMITVAVVYAPSATDATGQQVPTTLTSDGDTITMHVDHQDAGVTYPVLADPDVRVNDWAFVQHGWQPIYGLQARSHTEWRFTNTGYFYGHWSIYQSGWGHYFWGNDNQGHGLWNVYVPGVGWRLFHDVPWSGVFLPYQITVQDPPAKVLVGWQPIYAYEIVGYHYEFRFDANIDCQKPLLEEGYLPDCADQYEVDAGSTEPAATVQPIAGIASNRPGTATRRRINPTGTMVTFRSAPKSYAIGNAFDYWTIDYTRSPINGYLGGTLRNGYLIRCGWVEIQYGVGDVIGNGTTNCGDEFTYQDTRIPLSRFASGVNGAKGTGGGTLRKLIKGTPLCANVTNFYSVGKQECADKVGNISDYQADHYKSDGFKVLWRYVLRGRKFVMVNLRDEDRAEVAQGARWVFIHYDALKHPLCNRSDAGCAPTPNQ
jgi:hypothetical protein